MNPKKHILIVCDGLGDLPVPELANQTPLEAANTPNLDNLAKNGITGLMRVLGQGIRPNSDEAHLALLGYDWKNDYPGRGPIEAAGVGVILEDGDVAIRGNLATVDSGLRVIDRRAGRIDDTTVFVKDFDGMEIDGIKFIVKPGTGHRIIIVMRGRGLSDKITNSDVHYVTEDNVVENWEGNKVNVISPRDDSSEAKFTAGVLQKFLEKTHQILEKNPLNTQLELKGNYILTRGSGYYKKLTSFAEKWGTRACCIAGAGLYKGLGAITGMDLLETAGATGQPDTDVLAKIKRAKEALAGYNFVFVHIKATDIFGENGDFFGKRNFIERIDMTVKELIDTDAVIAVTADHSTPCSHKDHSADPVPVLIYSKDIQSDGTEKFGERYCKSGSLGIIEGKDFMRLFLNY